MADFDALHSRTSDHTAVACAFDLLMLAMISGDVRSASGEALRRALRARGGIQYVEHTEGDGEKMFAAVCKLGLEGIVSKRLKRHIVWPEEKLDQGQEPDRARQRCVCFRTGWRAGEADITIEGDVRLWQYAQKA